jgi:hypothetical protein
MKLKTVLDRFNNLFKLLKDISYQNQTLQQISQEPYKKYKERKRKINH